MDGRQYLLLVTLLFPLPASIGMLFARKYIKTWLSLVWGVESLLLLSLILFAPDQQLKLPFTVFVGHSMGLMTDHAGIELALLLSLSGLVLTLFASHTIKIVIWRSLLNLWSFSFAAFVIFSADFITRLIALELSVLCVSLYPLTEVSFPSNRRWMHVLEVYIPLRIAGVFLVSVIFSLAIQENTFQINNLLAGFTGNETVPLRLVWFLILAVAIKSAAAPFDRWLAHSSLADSPDWAYSGMVITSSLGYYLIYRFQPFLYDLRLLLMFAAMMIVSIAIIKTHFRRQPLFDQELNFISQNFPTVLILLATGEKPALFTFILLWIPLWSIWFLVRSRQTSAWYLHILAGVGLAVRIIVPLLVAKEHSFQQMSLIFFYGLLCLQALFYIQTILYPGLTSSEKELARKRSRDEFDERITFREWTQSIVDLEFHLDHLTRYANQFFRKVSRSINRLHNDSLDRYLYWTAFFIFLIFVFVFLG